MCYLDMNEVIKQCSEFLCITISPDKQITTISSKNEYDEEMKIATDNNAKLYKFSLDQVDRLEEKIRCCLKNNNARGNIGDMEAMFRCHVLLCKPSNSYYMYCVCYKEPIPGHKPKFISKHDPDPEPENTPHTG
jgi:hypothetical protein